MLDRDPSVVLCYPREIDIDERGKVMGRWPYSVNNSLGQAHERFRNLTSINCGSPADKPDDLARDLITLSGLMPDRIDGIPFLDDHKAD